MILKIVRTTAAQVRRLWHLCVLPTLLRTQAGRKEKDCRFSRS